MRDLLVERLSAARLQLSSQSRQRFSAFRTYTQKLLTLIHGKRSY
jgi:hypothetical protein